MGRNDAVWGGLFQGLAKGLEQRGKDIDAAEELYIELSQDKNLKLKQGKQYKPGMTKVQVRDLFEENPTQNANRFASDQLLDQATIDILAKSIPEYRGKKAGEITIGNATIAARIYGIDLNAALRNSAQQFDQNELKYNILKTYLGLSDKDQKKFSKDFGELLSLAKDESSEISIEQVETEAGKMIRKLDPAMLEKLKKIPILGGFLERPGVKTDEKTITPSPTPKSAPKAVTPAVTNVETDVTDEEQLASMYEELKSSGRIKPGEIEALPDDATVTKVINAKYRAMKQGSKLSTPGATDSPGVMQDIQQSFQRPQIGQKTRLPMGNSRPVGQVATPLGEAEIEQGKQKLMELARNYRDALARSGSPNSPSMPGQGMAGVRG